MNGNEYDGLDFGESCDYDVHECNEQLTAENAKLRAELAEAVGLLHDLPDMMGGDNWGDFLTLDDERRVLAVIEAKHAATA